MANRISRSGSVPSPEQHSPRVEQELRPETEVRDTLDLSSVPADHQELRKILVGQETQLKNMSKAQLQALQTKLIEASENIQPGWTTAVRGMLGGDTRQKMLGTTLHRVGVAIQDKEKLQEALTAKNLGAPGNNKMKALMTGGVIPTYDDVLTALKTAASEPSGESRKIMLEVLTKMAQYHQFSPEQLDQLRTAAGSSVDVVTSLLNSQGLGSKVDEAAMRQNLQKK